MIPTLAAGNPLDHVIDHVIVKTEGGLWLLSNHMIIMLLAAVLLVVIFTRVAKPYTGNDLVPTGARNFFEAILVYLRNSVVKPVLGDQTDRYMPFLWTLFFFILFNNLIGLIPLDVLTLWPVQRISGNPDAHAIYGTPTGNIYVTAVLALVSFTVIQVGGIRTIGLGNWARHFLGGAPVWMFPIMVPVEIIGMIVKPVALAIRLMANMMAGHILVATVVGFTGMVAGLGWLVVIGIAVPVIIGGVAIMCLELFVAFLQSYLFMFLTTLFIGQLVAHHGHDDHAHGHGHNDPHAPPEQVVGSVNMPDLRNTPPEARAAGSHAAAH